TPSPSGFTAGTDVVATTVTPESTAGYGFKRCTFLGNYKGVGLQPVALSQPDTFNTLSQALNDTQCGTTIETTGVLVCQVPTSGGSLNKGDVITKINGKKVNGCGDLEGTVTGTVTLTILRSGN
ncbi:MAG: hypothetical protein M1546_07480, partial [Chloroflexi bacterium]|nr:hypothetical protein [Chloroflexota bacterium]